ncbi:MAG: prolyl oligopeptidase family serine peptidase [Bacteroidales bacterium]|nr:prolyl oligopeptidase family serine peptidase [Bacteroidales bacterium]
MKKPALIALGIIYALMLFAKPVEVQQLRLSGPTPILSPLVIDSVDASQTKFDVSTLALNTTMPLASARKGSVVNIVDVPKNDNNTQPKLYVAQFAFFASRYTKAEVKVTGPSNYKVFVQEKEVKGPKDYQPGRYEVVVKFLADTAALKITVCGDDDVVALEPLDAATNAKRPFSLADNMEMVNYTTAQLSPNGRYALVGTAHFDANGKTVRKTRLIDVTTGRVLANNVSGEWMPRSNKLIRTRKVDGRSELVAIDPTTMQEEVLCTEMPDEPFAMSPTEDFLILMPSEEGPKREKGVYEILNPEDRQPGWRSRNTLALMNLKTGVVQPLTYTHKNVWLCDIAPDGKEIIFATSENDFTARPTTRNTIYRLNLETMKSDVLVDKDGFINSLQYIPNTTKLIGVGSPEAFNRIGCTLPDSLTPNQFDNQLFVMDAITREILPVTKDFDPSVEKLSVTADGQVFFTAQNADSVSLYRLDTKNWRINVVPQPVEVINGLSAAAQTVLYYGTSACVPARLYALNGKKTTAQLLDDPNAKRMAEIELGTCLPFRFTSKNGYPLTGHYYLPAHFDNTKKYPVIVHYYGGCSPSARRFGGGSHYPAHYWNAMGYVVLVVNPGGASGFGQAWGARHVNTMGEGVAEDIIEATEHFIADHTWVNAEKIGCVSASYGGFMTQLLLTKTDLFATGISHAGISDHTSYWGEGYWGYSYSEVCAANSYPWTRKDLFVERSPLYNADKIHKPLLFTHGTADTNVPIGESIQMYTALKLLGVPTAFIMVEGENHGIMDYTKRQLWINSMVAWFHKWLQDDTTWWDAIYSPKSL